MEEPLKETRKQFTFEVNEPGKVYSPAKWELPKKTKFVKGIQLTSDHPEKLYYRGSQKIEIGGEEIFPEGFESRILMSSLSVAPRERFFELGQVLPGDLSVKPRFEDQEQEKAAFAGGYMVSVVLLLQEVI